MEKIKYICTVILKDNDMATMDRIKVGYFKVLEYKTEYNSYDEFYNDNKTEIYETIVSMFEKFNTSTKDILTMNITVTIDGIFWNSDVSFTRDQYFVLKRDILPYFEENEDYEMCERIMKIHKQSITC